MRFLMRNCLKYKHQYQNGSFGKRVGEQWYPYQLYGPWLNIMYTLKYGESPITNVHKHALEPCYFLDFKIKYISDNLNLQSSKIIANISLKLICAEKFSRFGIPKFHIM